MGHPKSYLNETFLLSSKDVSKIVQYFGLNTIMDTLIDRITHALITFDKTKTHIPIRSGFNYQEPHAGLVEMMPIYQEGEQVCIKVVGYHPNNPASFGLPTILSTISNYDTSTGHLKCLIDGVLITALRTGATSAVASKLLAHPESKVLGLFGCGAQSITQLHAISRKFDLEKVLYYDIDPKTQASFTERSACLELNIDFVATSIDDLVLQSDILCTITSIDKEEGPLFYDLPTQDHLHVNAVGSDFPGKTELPLDLLRKSFVCPDFMEQALIEGECQQLVPEEVGPQLDQVLKNKEVYSKIPFERSVFDSTGYPLEDMVTMDLFIEYAQQINVGKYIGLENITIDPKDPYQSLNALPSGFKKETVATEKAN